LDPLRSRTDSFMSRIGANICHWRRAAAGLGLMGCLLATIAGSGLSRAEVGGSGAKNPILKPTFHGVVLTTNGVPITNATVTIKRVLAGRGAVFVSDAPDCNRQAMTKADGTFAFDGLAEDAKIVVVITAPGYELEGFCTGDWLNGPQAGLQGFWIGYPGAARPLKFMLRPSPAEANPQQTVYGRVVNGDGKPVAGAKILVHMLHTERDWHSGGGTAFTDQQGEFAFPPTENIIACDFTIEANGYVSRSFSEVPPGLGTNVYHVSQGARLTGRLLKDGQPVPDAGIGLYDVKGGDFLNNFSVVTDGNGRFTFSGLESHEEFCLFGIMRSLRELGALPRQHIKTGDDGTRIELGDLNLVKGYTISGRVQMPDGKPTRVGAFTLARTELTPPTDHAPTRQEQSNRSFYGLEHSFDNWRADPGADGKFEFTGVPGETVSIFLMLDPFDMVSPRNISSDGKGFRLLGVVVSNKTDLVIELEPHSGQVFPPARDYEALSRQPLQGAEAAVAK
jgi:Carboxypeptidase regulatory-like domain